VSPGRVLFALAATLATLAVFGCGGDAEGGQPPDPGLFWSTGTATVTMPLGEGTELATPEGAIAAWVAALNDRDWARACGMSLVPVELDCPATLRDAVGPRAGRVEVAGSVASRAARTRGGSFSVTNVDGLSELSAERHLGGYRVHFEIQRVR
jgi:hypothetical protein